MKRNVKIVKEDVKATVPDMQHNSGENNSNVSAVHPKPFKEKSTVQSFFLDFFAKAPGKNLGVEI